MKKAYIIAEAGVNHNGSIELAKNLIDVAVHSGADAVKFQTFRAEKLLNKNAPKAAYQLATTKQEESQFEMIKKLELDEEAHNVLISYCRNRQIQFLSTPFDDESLDLLANTYNLPVIKIPSGEITNAPFLLKVASTDKPVILSTGMSTLGEIETALGILAYGYLKIDAPLTLDGFRSAFSSQLGQQVLNEKVSILHCTTEYPTPFNEVNLLAMDTLSTAFGLPVGYSDHTLGIAVPIAAVARGAVIIEKHFTLSRDMSGPDHKASLEPDELKMMVDSIRQVEKSLGIHTKFATESELKNRNIARKSLVAAQDIQIGEAFTIDNLTVKRPGTGVAPINYWDWLGKKAEKAYKKDEIIN